MTTSSWGPYVWIFIHTFCERIHNDFFIKNKNTVINLLFGICKNLPCPSCTQHASSYLRNVITKRITNKDDLKRFFFDFHNDVNKRLHKDIYTDYDIYKNLHFRNIFLNFKYAYTNNYFLRNQLHVSHKRRLHVRSIEKFIRINIKQFY